MSCLLGWKKKELSISPRGWNEILLDLEADNIEGWCSQTIYCIKFCFLLVHLKHKLHVLSPSSWVLRLSSTRNQLKRTPCTTQTVGCYSPSLICAGSATGKLRPKAQAWQSPAQPNTSLIGKHMKMSFNLLKMSFNLWTFHWGIRIGFIVLPPTVFVFFVPYCHLASPCLAPCLTTLLTAPQDPFEWFNILIALSLQA